MQGDDAGVSWTAESVQVSLTTFQSLRQSDAMLVIILRNANVYEYPTGPVGCQPTKIFGLLHRDALGENIVQYV